MAIYKDREGMEKLKAVIARRLKISRKAAGLSENDAAKELGHKGITQVSLAEAGHRMPPLLDLIKYADLYMVPLDFLLGRINDPLAEADEQGNSLVARNLGQTIAGCFERFSSALSEHAALCISGYRHDREDAKQAALAAKAVHDALKRMRELNDDFDEMLGGAPLVKSANELLAIGRRIERRIAQENARLQTVDKALHLEEIELKIDQLRLQLA